MSVELDIKGLLSKTMELFKKNSANLLKVSVVYLVLVVLLNLIGQSINSLGFPAVLTFVFSIINLILVSYLHYGFLKISLKTVRSQSWVVKELFPKDHGNVLIYVVVASLSTTLTLFGSLFLIIPGIFLMLKFLMSSVLVVDQAVGPITALKVSWKTAEGHMWRLLAILVVGIAINVLGLVCLGVGLIFTVPFTMILYVLLYDTLLEKN